MSDDFDKACKAAGFEDEREFHRMIAALDFSTPERRAVFAAWNEADGTKAGLLKLRVTGPVRFRTGPFDIVSRRF